MSPEINKTETYDDEYSPRSEEIGYTPLEERPRANMLVTRQLTSRAKNRNANQVAAVAAREKHQPHQIDVGGLGSSEENRATAQKWRSMLDEFNKKYPRTLHALRGVELESVSRGAAETVPESSEEGDQQPRVS